MKAGNGRSARCLITDALCDPVATVLPVTGLQVVGGHARGDALICFDKAALCSYGLTQAANAPVSGAAMSAAKAALDQLLTDAPILAGMKFVRWYDRRIPQGGGHLHQPDHRRGRVLRLRRGRQGYGQPCG